MLVNHCFERTPYSGLESHTSFTVPICGVLLACVGCFEFYLRKTFATASNIGKKYFIFDLHSCFWLTEKKNQQFGLFFCVWPPFVGVLCFIHFGAIEKDLGYLRLWDCSPFLHRHANVDQLDSGTAVHSADKHQQARVLDDLSTRLWLIHLRSRG